MVRRISSIREEDKPYVKHVDNFLQSMKMKTSLQSHKKNYKSIEMNAEGTVKQYNDAIISFEIAAGNRDNNNGLKFEKITKDGQKIKVEFLGPKRMRDRKGTGSKIVGRTYTISSNETMMKVNIIPIGGFHRDYKL